MLDNICKPAAFKFYIATYDTLHICTHESFTHDTLWTFFWFWYWFIKSIWWLKTLFEKLWSKFIKLPGFLYQEHSCLSATIHVISSLEYCTFIYPLHFSKQTASRTSWIVICSVKWLLSSIPMYLSLPPASVPSHYSLSLCFFWALVCFSLSCIWISCVSGWLAP